MPVICEKAEKTDIPNISKKKYLVPGDLTVGQFVYVIRKRIKLSPDKAIFIFVESVLPATSASMNDIYAEYKDEDGFLYLWYVIILTYHKNSYSGENTLYVCVCTFMLTLAATLLHDETALNMVNQRPCLHSHCC